MIPPLSNEEIEEFLELESKATQGDWKFQPNHGITHESEDFVVEKAHSHATRSWAKYIARSDHGHDFDEPSEDSNNMQLICKSRNALKSLLLEVKAQRAELKQANAVIAMYADEDTWSTSCETICPAITNGDVDNYSLNPKRFVGGKLARDHMKKFPGAKE